MRILVLVLGARVAPYPALIRTIKQTWASVPVPGVETMFYFGGDSLSFKNGELVVPVADDHEHIGEKTLAAFDWTLANRDFDLLFRTNSSSYVDLPNLREYAVAQARSSGFYAGFIGSHAEIRFASGSGYFLTRDLVETVVRDRESWRHELIDDAALAALLASHGFRPVHTPRVDYTAAQDVVDVDLTQFHFRCHTDSRRRRDDGRIMHRLYRAFSEARGPSAGQPRRRLFAR